MSKKLKKGIETLLVLSEGFTIQHPVMLTRKFARQIGRLLNLEGLSFAQHVNEFSLVGGPGCQVRDKQRDHMVWVMPLKEYGAIGPAYWVTVYVIFVPFMLKFKLEQVKIMVFKGEMSDLNKEPFFRAEWFVPESGDNNAQPHWHVYKTVQETDTSDFEDSLRKIREEETQSSGEIFPFSPELSKKKSKPFSKFHFAMAAQWHKGNSHQVNFTSEEELINWLTGCIKYIQSQLIHIE